MAECAYPRQVQPQSSRRCRGVVGAFGPFEFETEWSDGAEKSDDHVLRVRTRDPSAPTQRSIACMADGRASSGMTPKSTDPSVAPFESRPQLAAVRKLGV